MKELTLDDVKKDLKSLENKFCPYVKIIKLSWDSDSLIPKIFFSKRKSVSNDTWEIIFSEIEKKLNEILEKYTHEYPHQNELFKNYEFFIKE